MVRARFLFALTLLLSTPALAEDSTPVAGAPAEVNPAAEHFERGVQLFKEQAFRAAIVEFQRAYDLAPDYRLHYNLGRAKQQLQDYLGAAENLEAYLVQGGVDVPPERRTQIEETLVSLGGRVARIDIEVNRPGADVFLDDVKVGTAPLDGMVRANVGRHRVSARAADGALGAEIVDVAGGDIAQVSIHLTTPPPSVASAERREATSERKPWSPRRKLALASLLAGGTLLAGSVATGVLSLRDQARLDEQVGELGVDRSAVESRRDRVDALSLTTDVLIGAGAALVVTGTVLWLLGRERTEQKATGSQGGRASERARRPVRASLGLDVGLGSLALGGRF